MTFLKSKKKDKKVAFKLAPVSDRLIISLITANIKSQTAFEAADMSEIDILSSLSLDNSTQRLNKEHIKDIIKTSDMLLLIVEVVHTEHVNYLLQIAQVSKELGILTIVIATMPFQCEDEHQFKAAENNIGRIKLSVDTVLVIPLHIEEGNMTTDELLAYKQSLTIEAVRSTTELATRQGLICVDFADIRAVTSHMGKAMMGTGYYKGNASSVRAQKASELALNSPTMDGQKLSMAQGVLVNIVSGKDISIKEFEDVGAMVINVIAPEAITLIGTAYEPDMVNEIRVSIIATGIN